MTGEQAEQPTEAKEFDASLLELPQGVTIPPAAHGSDYLEQVEKLTKHFGDESLELAVDETSNSAKRALNEREMMFLSKETFQRFIIATKGDVNETINRLENAVIWRRSVDIENVQAMAEDCEQESQCGKNFVMGYSKLGRPIIYFFPNRNTTPVELRRPINAIFLLERARDLMPAGVSSVMVIFNFSGKRQGPPASVSNTRYILNVLSSYYPETLGLSHLQNMPWIVRTFVNLMWPFVDPATKKKVSFGDAAERTLVNGGHVDASQLLIDCGGNLDMPYHHDTYWPALVEKCLQRRREHEIAFRQGPATVGRSEAEWRRRSDETASTA